MLASLVKEKEKSTVEDSTMNKTLLHEKQEALEDLANVEAAFSDVHRYINMMDLYLIIF